MGMIYTRGNVYWIKYYRNGKPYRESTRSNKEADAKRLLRKREGEISEGKLPGVYFDKVRFDELAEEMLTDYRINNRKSIVRAEISIEHLKKHFEGVRITQITTPRIKAYIEERLADKAANATINNELKALKRMLNLGAKQTPPKVDRVPYIPMLKENNVRQGFFEHGDFLALKDQLPEYLKGLVTFAYKSGWRKEEIFSLTWDRVDLNGGIVRLNAGETKNDESRIFYLDAELKEIFKQLQEDRKKSEAILPYVFPNRDKSGKITDIRKAWKSACKDAKIGTRLFHDFRRTAIRNMVRAGIPERVAMMISGHKTRTIFERYNIVSEDDLIVASQRQAAYLETQTGTVSGTVHDFTIKKEASNGS